MAQNKVKIKYNKIMSKTSFSRKSSWKIYQIYVNHLDNRQGGTLHFRVIFACAIISCRLSTPI